MSLVHYVLTDPSTLEELEALILLSTDYAFTFTGKRTMLDQLATKRGDELTVQTFECVVHELHPIPRSEYFILAATTDGQQAIRVENQEGTLLATVMDHDPLPSP